tara:strand:- start:112 stop:537 length:426 start_codon:yes stop_codon:yes gene_type:complete
MKSYLLVFFLIFISCDKSFKAPKPEVLLEESVMEEVLYDISLLKAAKSKNYKILKDNNVKADVYIYNKYKIDSVTLRQNIAYYATNSFKTAKQIEERLRLKFEDQKSELEKKIKDSLEKKKIKDSLKSSEKKIKKDILDLQ